MLKAFQRANAVVRLRGSYCIFWLRANTCEHRYTPMLGADIRRECLMDRHDALAGAQAALQDAALDVDSWPSAWALIGEACGNTGHSLIVAGGSGPEATLNFAQFFRHGQRRTDLEREYFQVYCPHDERIPHLRRLPDGRVVAVRDLYSEEERKTSVAYNEWVCRLRNQNGLNVRLDGPNGTRIVWSLGSPIASGGWGSAEVELIKGLLPHIRQFVRIRQALAGADALGVSVVELLDHAGIGLILLDRRGRVVEANGPACSILRRRDGLSDRGRFLAAWLPADNTRLQRLVAGSLPSIGSQDQTAGSMTVARPFGLPKLALHINPVRGRWLDMGLAPVAVLVLVLDPSSRPRFDAGVVGSVLGLSAAESEVAVMLAQDRTTVDIAQATGRQASTVKVLTRRAYRKLGISRRAELVRQVLSLADVSAQH